jgi:hypothetical protein
MPRFARCRFLNSSAKDADVLQVGEKAFGIRITFATENFVAVHGELVEKILLLARRLPWHAVVRHYGTKAAPRRPRTRL